MKKKKEKERGMRKGKKTRERHKERKSEGEKARTKGGGQMKEEKARCNEVRRMYTHLKCTDLTLEVLMLKLS